MQKTGQQIRLLNNELVGLIHKSQPQLSKTGIMISATYFFQSGKSRIMLRYDPKRKDLV